MLGNLLLPITCVLWAAGLEHAKVAGQPQLTYDHGKNCGDDLIMECRFTGVFDAASIRSWTYAMSAIIDSGLSIDQNKYTESIATAGSSYFTMTIKGVTVSDTTGDYTCEYNFSRSAAVTLEYECYDNTVDIHSDSSNKVTITVDRVYPDLPATTLMSIVYTSSGTAIPGAGAVTSAASTTAGYTDHFTLTWTSTDAVPDGTYTYTVVIQTNAAGTPVVIAVNPITFGDNPSPYTSTPTPSDAAWTSPSWTSWLDSSISTIPVAGQLKLTYHYGKNCDDDLIMKCHFTGAFDAASMRSWRYLSTMLAIISSGISIDPNKYTESIATSALSYFTMTIKGVTVSDTTGDYTCEYGFSRSAAVTLEYECYDAAVDITRDINSNKVTIIVDRVYPDWPTTTLTVTLTNSAGTDVPGAVTSAASTTAGYTDHFTLTWTSTVAVPDGTYTYTVVIQTNAAGTPVRLADNVSKKFVGGCPPDLDSRGLYWNDSFPGRTEYKECPAGSTGRVTRHCSPAAVYDPPIYDCTSSVIANLQTELDDFQSGKGNVSLVNVLDQLAKTTAPASADLYAGDIDTIQNMLNVVQHIASTQPTHQATQKVQTDKVLDVASNLVDKSNTESWKSLLAKDGSGTDNLLGIIDTYAETIATSTLTGRVGEDTEYVKTNLVLKVGTTSKCSHSLQYPGQGSDMPMWIKGTANNMQLPCGSVGTQISYAGAVYRDLSDTMPLRLDNTTMSGESSHYINGPVMSLSLYPKRNATQLTESIEISVQVFDTKLRKPACSYWNINTSSRRGMWSTDGCVLKSYSQTDGVVVCLCNHLTNFAILMSPGGVVDEDHAKALSIISAVGCTLSMLCLFVAFIVYIVYWRYVRCDRAIIHMHLYVCLFVAYGLFLGGVTRTNIKLLCTIIAALLHCVYLVVFMLMLTEGLDLAIRIRNISNRRPYWRYMIPGSYALPAVIVGVSLAIDTDGYGNEAFCWLSTSSGLIYAFIAPAVIVILINTVVIVLAMNTLYQTKSMSKKTDFEKAKAGLRSISVLLPIMGITWLFGVFSVNEDTVAFQYLFALFNSAQGLFIFIFHCVLNAKVQEGFQRTKSRLLVSYSLGSEMQHSSSGTAASKSTSAS